MEQSEGASTADNDRDSAPTDSAPRSATLIGAAVFVVLALLLALFASRASIVGSFARRTSLPLLVAAVQCLAAIGASSAVRAIFARAVPSRVAAPRASTLAIDLVAGYPVFGAAVFVVALVTAHKAVMLALLVAFAAAGVMRARGEPRGDAPAESFDGAAIVALIALAVGLCGAVMQAQLPAFTLDEVVYHLALPKAWLLEGRAVETPLNSQSYFPLGVESADLPALALLGDRGALASHFAHVASAGASCVMLFRWLERRVSASNAAVATAAVATTPALLLTTGWSWNEWPLLGLCLALLASLDAFDRDRDDASALAGVTLSIAGGMLCKYTFLAFAAPALLASLSVVRSDRERLRSLVRAAAVGASLGAVFLLRNLAQTGNPIAPFLDPLGPHVSSFREGTSVASALSAYVYDEGTADESLGVTLFAGALSLALCARSMRGGRFLSRAAAGLALTFAALAAARPSARLLAPMLAGVAVVGMIALSNATPGSVGCLARWGFAAASVAQLLLVWALFDYMHPFATLGANATERTFLMASRTSYEHVEWIDQHVPAGSRTLVIGLNQLFWMSHRFGGGGNFDGPRMAAYLEADSPMALHLKLRRDGYTHVALFRPRVLVGAVPVAGRYAEAVTVLTPRAVSALQGVLSIGTIARGERAGVELYELR